ncbi:MAG: hypothetical protein GEV00_13100 [Actinophytocola sp.]|nr:hypothetical protein [Actinophytocola sp.]
MHREPKTDIRLAVMLAVFASIGAGVIHAVVAPRYLAEWQQSGMFFAALALFQLAWAVFVARWPWPALLGVGLLANAGVMCLWVYTRALGLPFGPEAGVPQPVGAPGVLAMMLEASVVLGVIWSLLPRRTSATLSTSGYRFAVAGAGLAMLLLVTPGVVTALGLSA